MRLASSSSSPSGSDFGRLAPAETSGPMEGPLSPDSRSSGCFPVMLDRMNGHRACVEPHKSRLSSGLSLVVGLVALLSVTSTPAIAAETCAKNALSHVQELLDESRRRILVVEYSEARTFLDEAQSCLSRLDGLMTPALLGRLFQDQGMARLQLGDERGASEAFRRASVMSPEVRWEPRLGSKAMGNFLTIKEDVLLSSRRRIRFPTLMPGSKAALDGIPLDKTLEREVFPGTHLLQVQEEDGSSWLGALIDVPVEGSISPLPSVLVGRIFRSNTVLVLNADLKLETNLSPGPGAFVKRVTLGGAVGGLVLGGAALVVSGLSRQAIYDQSFSTLEEGEGLRTRANLSLGAGLGLTGLGLILSGASITMEFGYRSPAPAGDKEDR